MLVVVTGCECWWLLQVMSVGGCYRLQVLEAVTGYVLVVVTCYGCWWLLQVTSDVCYRL